MKILVPEAHAMGSIACIRSLGRAGHHVIAMSDHSDALGFRSKYCNEQVVVPTGLSPQQATEWLLSAVNSLDVDLVLPSEGLVATLGTSLPALADKIPCGPDASRLARFVNKYDLFESFLSAADERLTRNLPPTKLVNAGEKLDVVLDTLSAPLFAKFDAVRHAGLGSKVLKYNSKEQALQQLPNLLAQYDRCVLQSFVPGHGVGVFFLRWDGRIVATLMHRRLHEVPHTGGVSSLRETWWDETLYADALRRIESMDWWGVGMLEYRFHTPGEFSLMEFNARFWGSLHLALFANVDFPRLLVDVWSGQTPQAIRAEPGVRCRWTFPKEIEHYWSVLRDPKPSIPYKVRACLQGIALSLDPRVHSDLWMAGDRGLYWEALRRTPAHFLRG